MYAYPVGPARDVSFHSPFPVLRLPLFSHFTWNEKRQRLWTLGTIARPLFGLLF